MQLLQKIKTRRQLLIIGSLIVFLLANVGAWAYYRDRTYPRANLGHIKVGGQTGRQLMRTIPNLSLLPSHVSLAYDKATTTTTPTELGIRPDTSRLASELTRHHWLPVYNFMAPRHVTLVITTDDKKLQQTIQKFADQHRQAPQDARPIIQDGLFQLKPATAGQTVDTKKAQKIILAKIVHGDRRIALPATPLKPTIKDQKIQPIVSALQAQQKLTLAYTYQNKTAKPSPADIAAWYDDTDSGYALSDPKIQTYVVKAGNASGIRVQNLAAAVAATRKAMESNKALSFELVPPPRPTKNYTYCTAGRGVDAGYLGDLDAKLNAAYHDNRGWNLDGQITFSKATNGCNFTVWLAAADQTPSFGAICDTIWSCTVRPNVVINFDRWQDASAAWNAAGGSLDDYRSMVINHETGHWLGFDHKSCGGPAQAAPIMLQQSISLQGCTFNPWPLPSERDQLRSRLGL